MAWLFSCFRCKQKRHHRSSSPHPSCKLAVENSVLTNANVFKAQERGHPSISLEQSRDAAKQGADADRSLLTFLKTETTCRKQLSDEPWWKEGHQQAIDDFKRVKDLKDEANDLQDLLDPSSNFRRAFDDLQMDSEEGQEEKGRHVARLHSLLTKIDCERETLGVDDMLLQEQNKLGSNNGVGIGAPFLSSTENKSQLCDIEASKELCKFPSNFSPATQKEAGSSLKEETDLISPDKTLLERAFQNWRGCSSETKVKQSGRSRDALFESTPQNIEDPLVISRSKRSFRALSFSEFSLVEAAAGNKLTSKKLELEDSRRTESPVARRTISINRITAFDGETDDEITRSFTDVSGTLATSSEQAISLSVSQDAALYETDMEFDSKAFKPYSNGNLLGRPHGYVQGPKYNAHEVRSCADSTMDQSQAFTFEDSCNEISQALSQFFTDCKSKAKVLGEEVEELDIDQMNTCSDASSFLTSPLPKLLSERDKGLVRKTAHLQATQRESVMLQENSAESSADCGKSMFDRKLDFGSTETGGCIKRLSSESLNSDPHMLFEEANLEEIKLPDESMPLSANIADLGNKDKLLSSKLSDDVTSRPSRRSLNMGPESCTYSRMDHMRELSCNELVSLEVSSFSVPSPETVNSLTHMQSPLPLHSPKEVSSARRIVLNLPQETPSVSKPLLEISSTNLLKQQPTPKTPSACSSEVETPNSIQSVFSPADLAKDRPIMGTVAAHWSHSSSKEKWDGKGIPNSTNKYKEDQKVSWHATPFEVRLERALAKQGRVFQKKLFGGAMPPEMEPRTEPITSSG